MVKVFNRAKMTTSTVGTGALTLVAAVTKFQSFAAAGAVNNDVVQYVIEDGNAWEIGIGTYGSAGTTLTRTLQESSTGSLLNLSGSAQVFITATDDTVQNSVDIKGGAIQNTQVSGDSSFLLMGG